MTAIAHSPQQANNEPNFSDPEDYVDNELDDEPSLKEIRSQRPVLNTKIDNVVIIDNIPQVGLDRLEKLKLALSKLLSKCGNVIDEDYPIDLQTGTTLGYMIVKFDSVQAAQAAKRQLDRHRLDKSHQFSVNTFDEFDMSMKVQNEWTKPKIPEYVECCTLYNWLLAENAIDQFAVAYNGLTNLKQQTNMCAVYLNTFPQPRCLISREMWTEKNFAWSPKGTLLTSFHEKGLMLWGGDKFERQAKILHPNVSSVLFSPCERYLFSSGWINSSRVASVYVSDISVSTVRRMFTHEIEHVQTEDDIVIVNAVGNDKLSWMTNPAPIPFKWSYDGAYFAKIGGPDLLSVYSSETFTLLNKKSLKVPSIRAFAWASSKKHYLAMYQAEMSEKPARLSVINIPDQSEVRGQNMFNVADCQIFWQPSSDFICFQVDRYTKQKKEADKFSGKISHNFEIFRIRDKQCPVETMELKSKVLHFSWEPNVINSNIDTFNNRFVIIHETAPNKTKVSFYRVLQTGIESLKELNVEVNHAEWSPTGSFIVLSSFRGKVGHRLYFIDCSDLSVIVEEEHHMMSCVNWDPTGRYVVSCACAGHNITDAGYIIWSAQGKCLSYMRSNDFSQFVWRPRHSALLDDACLKEIRRNYKQYAAKFKEQDDLLASQLSAEQLSIRNQQFDVFSKFKQNSVSRLQKQGEERARLRHTGEIAKPAKFEYESFDFLLSIDSEKIKI